MQFAVEFPEKIVRAWIFFVKATAKVWSNYKILMISSISSAIWNEEAAVNNTNWT